MRGVKCWSTTLIVQCYIIHPDSQLLDSQESYSKELDLCPNFSFALSKLWAVHLTWMKMEVLYNVLFSTHPSKHKSITSFEKMEWLRSSMNLKNTSGASRPQTVLLSESFSQLDCNPLYASFFPSYCCLCGAKRFDFSSAVRFAAF